MRQTDDGPEMTDPKVEYEQLIEVARLALGRGDRAGAESALLAAIEMTDGIDDLQLERADALMRLGALKHEMGIQSEAERLLRDALDVSERALGSDDVGLIPALTSLGTVLIARGAPEEARPLLTRALGISESHLGADHPDLVVLLNELSRLYLKRAAYAFAEPLLLRLLTIKRAKGDEHPEVATVLASLGTVRQGLGDHDGAEQLFRRALHIREKTLAPNHFAIAATLEHLADTCAARGKFSEALALYQRALPMREMTLGMGHASVRVARERIADLQLQASEESFDIPGVRESTPTGMRESTPPLAITQALQPPPHAVNPARPIQRRTPTQGRAATPAPVKEREKTPPTSSAPVPPPAIAGDPASAPTSAAIPSSAVEGVREAERQVNLNLGVLEAQRQTPNSAVIPWFEGLHAVEAELKEIDKRETPAARALAVVGSANTVLQSRATRTAIIVGGTVALLLAGFALKSRLGGETDQRIFAEPGPRAEPAMVVALPLHDSTPASPRAASSNTREAGSAREASGTREVATRTRADSVRTTLALRSSRAVEPRERSAPKKPVESERKIEAPRLASPIVANIALPGIDAANLPTRNIRDSFAVRLSGIGSGRTVGSDVESTRAATIPRLIGSAPVPKYPDVLRDRQVQGQVIVQFLVDDKGRADVASMKVVQSPHDMLTSAVRTALPQFRFEPARTAPPESKPRSEWVKYAFQFSATK